MKYLLMFALVLMLAIPAEASIGSKIKKVATAPIHAVKEVGKKVGKVVLYVAAGVAVIAFCSQGACS